VECHDYACGLAADFLYRHTVGAQVESIRCRQRKARSFGTSYASDEATAAKIKALIGPASDPESASCRHLVEADIDFETKLRDETQNMIGG
jgi:hypothetical protein